MKWALWGTVIVLFLGGLWALATQQQQDLTRILIPDGCDEYDTSVLS